MKMLKRESKIGSLYQWLDNLSYLKDDDDVIIFTLMRVSLFKSSFIRTEVCQSCRKKLISHKKYQKMFKQFRFFVVSLLAKYSGPFKIKTTIKTFYIFSISDQLTSLLIENIDIALPYHPTNVNRQTRNCEKCKTQFSLSESFSFP